MDDLLKELESGNNRSLARFISMVENEVTGYRDLLAGLTFKFTPIIGITGPPGAGKSTLINGLASYLLNQNKRVAIVAVDPSSPFNMGSLMGDRLRMSEHFLNPNLYIRSMASRGSLGGLAPKIFEVCDVLRAANFDAIIIETVGVGQSEVEIAGLADTTVLVLVPEAGDDIQTIKSGIMEIADIFVLNKADRDGADIFYKNLSYLAHTHADSSWEIPVIKTVANKNEGVDLLVQAIENHSLILNTSSKKIHLLAQKAMMMIKNLRTLDIHMTELEKDLQEQCNKTDFNLYSYIERYSKQV